jgi:hypothetical protein
MYSGIGDVYYYMQLYGNYMVKTTILIERHTREQLRKKGSKGQTYDEVIINLLKSIDSLDTGLGKRDSSESFGDE